MKQGSMSMSHALVCVEFICRYLHCRPPFCTDEAAPKPFRLQFPHKVAEEVLAHESLREGLWEMHFSEYGR